MEDEWISATYAYDLVRKANSSRAAEVICSRAHDGLIAAKAQTLFIGGKRHDDAKIPTLFWWAKGHAALNQNWALGDFDTWLRRVHWRVYGVKFLRHDIMSMLPLELTPAPSVEGTTEADLRTEPVSRGGRPKSENWNNWIAELANYIHEEGIPAGSGAEGQDTLFSAVEERLAARGLESPARTTVQPAVRAVLLRLRSAGN